MSSAYFDIAKQNHTFFGIILQTGQYVEDSAPEFKYGFGECGTDYGIRDCFKNFKISIVFLNKNSILQCLKKIGKFEK